MPDSHFHARMENVPQLVIAETSPPVNATDSQEVLQSATSFHLNDIQAKSLVRDLHKVNPTIYWVDLLVSAAIGWICIALAVALRPFSVAMLTCCAVSVVALYRALCFIHEISHQNERTLPGFEAAWNILAGFPLLMPSFVYCGVHNDHHKVSTYGTCKDPEYLPFARSAGMTLVFAIESFFIPAVLLIRFLLLAVFGLLSRRFQRWLLTHAS